MDAPALSEELADFRRYLELEFSKLENRLDDFARRLSEMVPAHFALSAKTKNNCKQTKNQQRSARQGT